MAASKDSLLDLERRRTQLEKAVADLRKSLQHWQIWEAEYEGLKEEISALGEKSSNQKLDGIGKDFGGVLLNENEIKLLLEDGKGQKRDAAQILDVQENVKVSKKRLLAAEDKLSAVEIVINPEARTEDGLPLTEIIEELDDDGNVISSLISTSGEAASQVVDTLRKAGVKDLPEPPQNTKSVSPSAEAPSSSSATPLSSVPEGQSTNEVLSTERIEAQRSAPNESLYIDPSRPRQKKSVSFTEDTKKTDSTGPKVSSFISRKSPVPFSSNDSKSGQLREDHSGPLSPETADESISSPVIPANESSEDAAIRHQMLQYNLNEVGAIVAEMDLEDTDSSENYSEGPDDDFGSTTDEEEDQFGRTTKRVVDDDYRQQMMELERKLNAKMLVNVGPNPNIPNAPGIDHTEGKKDEPTDEVVITSTKIGDEKSKGKKGVRFADELDVAELPQLGPPSVEQTVVLDNASCPVSETIVERAEVPRGSNAAANTSKKVSKFKTARNPSVVKAAQNRKDPNTISHDITNGPLAQSGLALPLTPASSKRKVPPIPSTYATEVRSRKAPEGPPGKTHAEVLIERPTPQTEEEITEPDEFDPALMQQELAVEYYHMRNRMIQRNGGFVQEEEESEQIPLSEDGDDEGGGRRISKFKAARLGRLSR
ncbi:hypothetical protein MMC30_002273 [Trapelia coarctata]|nr:hypothetical protein [Trapelia coarctata]